MCRRSRPSPRLFPDPPHLRDQIIILLEPILLKVPIEYLRVLPEQIITHLPLLKTQHLLITELDQIISPNLTNNTNRFRFKLILSVQNIKFEFFVGDGVGLSVFEEGVAGDSLGFEGVLGGEAGFLLGFFLTLAEGFEFGAEGAGGGGSVAAGFLGREGDLGRGGGRLILGWGLGDGRRGVLGERLNLRSNLILNYGGGVLKSS